MTATISPLVPTVGAVVAFAVLAWAAERKTKQQHQRIEAIEEMQGWLKAAKELGEEAAANAASWVTDARQTPEDQSLLLVKLQEGDYEDWELPARPTLSGEWAGEPTLQSICEELGMDPEEVEDKHGIGSLGGVMNEIGDAWDEGVAEMFVPACELHLMQALEDLKVCKAPDCSRIVPDEDRLCDYHRAVHEENNA